VKKFVFLAPEFPPDKFTGSIRVSRFAKYLSKFGNSVTVIAPKTRDQTQQGLLDELKNTHVIRRSVSRLPLINDHSLSFFKSTLVSSVKKCYVSRPDYLLVSGPPYFHFIQGAMLSSLFDIKLILDYRDLWTGDPYSPKTLKSKIAKRFSIYLERWVLSRAHLSIYVSNAMLKDQKKIFPFLCDKSSIIISTGFDLETISSIKRYPNKLNVISHVGNADSDMNISDIAGLVQNPVVSKWFDNTGCRLYFVGRKNHEIACLIPNEYRKYFTFSDYLPHAEAMEVMVNSRGLLILGSNSSQRLNRKVFEYTALNKNVLFVGNATSPTSDIVRSFNGVISEPSNLVENFIKFVTTLKDGPPLIKKEFAAENLVRKLEDRLNERARE